MRVLCFFVCVSEHAGHDHAALRHWQSVWEKGCHFEDVYLKDYSRIASLDAFGSLGGLDYILFSAREGDVLVEGLDGVWAVCILEFGTEIPHQGRCFVSEFRRFIFLFMQ